MNLISWLRDQFRDKVSDLGALPQPPSRETIERLIGKTTGEAGETSKFYQTTKNLKHGDNEKDNSEIDPDSFVDYPDAAQSEGNPSKGKEGCCPYAVKRNIVASIREVKRFAEEHELEAAIVKSLLLELAEIGLDLLKGKVNSGVLLLLLHALNYHKAKEEAFREGELAGRNAKIEETYFPKNDDGLPHLSGSKTKKSYGTDLFSIARDA